MKPSQFKIKTGQEIITRVATIEDAPALLAMKLDYLNNSKTIPLFQEEYPNDPDLEVEIIKRLKVEKNSVLFVAEYQGKLIGNIDLSGNQRRKLFHTGVIGMGIREEWRGKGIGTALLNTVLAWSNMNPFITLLWLEVYQTNEAGIALYHKMGFVECGRMQNFFREENKFIDKITMVRHL